MVGVMLQGSGPHCATGGIRHQPWRVYVKETQNSRLSVGHTTVHHWNRGSGLGHALPARTAVDLGNLARVRYTYLNLNRLTRPNEKEDWLLLLVYFTLNHVSPSKINRFLLKFVPRIYSHFRHSPLPKKANAVLILVLITILFPAYCNRINRRETPWFFQWFMREVIKSYPISWKKGNALSCRKILVFCSFRLNVHAAKIADPSIILKKLYFCRGLNIYLIKTNDDGWTATLLRRLSEK